MSKRLVSLSIACLVALQALSLAAQDKKPAGAAQPSQEDMAVMMAAATPGPHHKKMMESVGTWETTSKWMQPGAPPETGTGAATIEGMMGGRFIMEVQASPMMMGVPWEGRGVFGYDNVAQKHVGAWFDTWGTGIMRVEGTCDGACKTVTFTGSYLDPLTKSNKSMKIVGKTIDADHSVTELYDVGPDGKAVQVGEIKYTRKKS